eukprot:m.184794 g.184794  ORF g.184794 m.184794 type:complete len:402 (-) comp15018_c0_seq9:429-1634(-)
MGIVFAPKSKSLNGILLAWTVRDVDNIQNNITLLYNRSIAWRNTIGDFFSNLRELRRLESRRIAVRTRKRFTHKLVQTAPTNVGQHFLSGFELWIHPDVDEQEHVIGQLGVCYRIINRFTHAQHCPSSPGNANKRFGFAQNLEKHSFQHLDSLVLVGRSMESTARIPELVNGLDLLVSWADLPQPIRSRERTSRQQISTIIKGCLDVQVIAVTTKVIPFVNIHSVPLVCHNLVEEALVFRPANRSSLWICPVCRRHSRNELFNKLKVSVPQSARGELPCQVFVGKHVPEHHLGSHLVLPYRCPRLSDRVHMELKRVRERAVPKIVAQTRDLDTQHIHVRNAELWLNVPQSLNHQARKVTRLPKAQVSMSGDETPTIYSPQSSARSGGGKRMGKHATPSQVA